MSGKDILTIMQFGIYLYLPVASATLLEYIRLWSNLKKLEAHHNNGYIIW